MNANQNDTRTATIYNSTEADEIDDIDELSKLYIATESIDVPSDPEDNEATYIVNIEPSGQEIFLVVSDITVKEKDTLTGR